MSQEMTTTTNGEFSIVEFCERHGACEEGRQWAAIYCRTMQDVWQTARPAWLLWVASRPGVLSAETLRQFLTWALTQIPLISSSDNLLAFFEGCRDLPSLDEQGLCWRVNILSTQACEKLREVMADWLLQNTTPSFKPSQLPRSPFADPPSWIGRGICQTLRFLNGSLEIVNERTGDST